MKKFAKLFDTSQGQFLVTRETDEDGCPAVLFRSYYQDKVMLTSRLSFEDSEEGLNRADKVFDKLDQEEAERISKSSVEYTDNVFKGNIQ